MIIVIQGPSISLCDAICWILWEFKQTGQAANMPEIIAKIAADFPSIPVSKHMTATVHKALGSLIRDRKVYYTGTDKSVADFFHLVYRKLYVRHFF